MLIDDFKLGAIFLYANNPHDENLLGIGEVFDIIREDDRDKIKIVWLWHPDPVDKTVYTKFHYYTVIDIESWMEFCNLLTEKEKLSLLLKNNFG